MPDPKRPGGRRWPWLILAGPLLGLMVLGLWMGVRRVQVQGRTQRRIAWLDRAESEIGQQIQLGLPPSVGSDATKWLGPDTAQFGDGRAAWRVHSFHFDPREGDDWSGIGDLAVVIDDRGRKFYSRSHFCDGTLPWALGSPDSLPPRPDTSDAFLRLFRPGTWTADRSVVETAMPPMK
jgi:hypothetical protein